MSGMNETHVRENEMITAERRRFLSGMAAVVVGSAAGLPLAQAAEHPDLSSGHPYVSVLHWSGGATLTKPLSLRAGWRAACASTRGLGCNPGLHGELTPARAAHGPMDKPMRLGVQGFGGASWLQHVELSTPFRADGLREDLPFILGTVTPGSNNVNSQQLGVWAVDGQLSLKLRMRARGPEINTNLRLPGQRGNYLVLIADRAISPRSLRLEATGGNPLQRQLVDRSGKLPASLGYFLLGVDEAVHA